MHMHKMFKKLHKRGLMGHPGMDHHVVHGMHHMVHHKPWKAHPMGHHKKHWHKFHKKNHHMKPHHRRCSSSSSSSRSSSSDSDSEDEGLVDGICGIQIGNQQPSKGDATDVAENVTAMAQGNDGDGFKFKIKCKKNKHFDLKGKHKKGKCKKNMIEKLLWLNAAYPQWRMGSGLGGRGHCRNRGYDKGRFSLPPPEISPRDEESAAAEANNPTTEEEGRQRDVWVGSNPMSLRRRRQGDSVDLFMLSIAAQVKKMSPQKVAQIKLKLLETVNELQHEETLMPSTSGEGVRVENNQQQNPVREEVTVPSTSAEGALIENNQ